MLALIKEATAEIEVKKSKFIAIAYPVTKLTDVKDIVKQTWINHPNASHVVHSAVIGKDGSQYSFSDDREPKNTAGRPSFEVLKGSGVTNICICIVRYFGGILLGTGGLVKAYGDATKEVLKCIETEPLIERIPFSLYLQYEHYTLVKRLLEKLEIKSEEIFSENIAIKGNVKKEDQPKLIDEIHKIGQGRITINI